MDLNADLGESFGGGLTRLEVDYLRREEWARSTEDVLWRHSKAAPKKTMMMRGPT